MPGPRSKPRAVDEMKQGRLARMHQPPLMYLGLGIRRGDRTSGAPSDAPPSSPWPGEPARPRPGGRRTDLLQLGRRGGAVFDGLDQRLGQAVGLVEVHQAVAVGVAFDLAAQGVDDWSAQQAQHRQDHRQHRQAGRIGDARYALGVQHAGEPGEGPIDDEEGDDRQRRESAGDPQRVQVGVVAHLVADHAAHLGDVRALLEHHVAHRHPRRAAQARDVGGVGVGLLGAVIDEDLVVGMPTAWPWPRPRRGRAQAARACTC
jgi:hypothetical protein